MIQIRLHRDSVAAGDDVTAPNARVVEFAERPRACEFLTPNTLRQYFPSVHLSFTVWDAFDGDLRLATLTHGHSPAEVLDIEYHQPDHLIEGDVVWFRKTGSRANPMDPEHRARLPWNRRLWAHLKRAFKL